MYPTAASKTLFTYVTTTGLVTFDGSYVVSTSGLTNATIYVNGVQASTLTANAWNLLIITHDEATATNFNLGSSSFLGNACMLRTFNAKLTEIERLQLWHEFNRKLGGGSDFGAYVPAPLNYWDLKNTLADNSGSLNGTAVSTSFTTDRLGISNCAITNTANNAHVTLPSVTQAIGDVTVFSFFKGSTVPTGAQTFDPYISYAGNPACVLRVGNNWNTNAASDRLEFIIRDSGATLTECVKTTAGLFDGNWHTIAGRRIGTGYAVFIDGVSVATTTGTGSALSGTTELHVLAYNTGGVTNPSQGETMVFNSGLSDAQIKLLHDSFSGRYPYAFRRSIPQALQSKFIAWLPGYLSGTTVYDLSGNGNNGTAEGSPAVSRAGQNPCITFDGSNDTVTFPNLANIYGVTVFAKPTAASKTLATIASGKTISLGASYELTSSGLTSPVYWRDDAVATAGSGSKWGMYTVGFSAETSSSGSWGTSSLTGNSGDFILWKEPPTNQAVQMLHKALYRN